MSNLTSFVNSSIYGFTFNGTSSPVAGIVGSFGYPELIGIAGILVVLFICIKSKSPIDKIAVSLVTLAQIFSTLFIPEWAFWLFILIGGVVFGLGLNKVIKNR